MAKIADDVIASGKVSASTPAAEKIKQRLISRYQRLVSETIDQFGKNAKAYINRRVFADSLSGKLLQHVLREATFIPAHPTRFQAGGFDVTDTQYFVLHRPGRNPKASRLDNIVREFSYPNREAATHFVTGKTGEIIQMVDLADIAYHCGASRPATNVNSVGVEMEGAVGEGVPDALYKATALLIARIHQISGMPLDKEHILQHFEILPKEKVDAGKNVSKTRLINLAKEIVGKSTGTDWYKEPFAPIDTVFSSAIELVQLAELANASQLERSILQSATASSMGLARAMFFSTFQRDEIPNQAAAHAIRSQNAISADAAFRLNRIGKTVEATPQENVEGILYDKETGLMNDGEPP